MEKSFNRTPLLFKFMGGCEIVKKEEREKRKSKEDSMALKFNQNQLNSISGGTFMAEPHKRIHNQCSK